jgi:hypothetical protein
MATLLIERGFKWANHIRKSRCCCGVEIEMQSDTSPSSSDDTKKEKDPSTMV